MADWTVLHALPSSSGVLAAVSDHEGTAQFVTAFMRSSLNESAVDYTFLAAQGVAASHVLAKLITPARLLADPRFTRWGAEDDYGHTALALAKEEGNSAAAAAIVAESSESSVHARTERSVKFLDAEKARLSKEEEDKNFLKRLTHVNLSDKKIDVIEGLEGCLNLQCLYLTDNDPDDRKPRLRPEPHAPVPAGQPD